MSEGVQLTERHRRAVDEAMDTGEFSSPEQVIDEALRLLKNRRRAPSLADCEALLGPDPSGWNAEALRAALQEGLDSGSARRLDPEEFLSRMRREHLG